jgi:hypothetical protein
MFSKCANPDCEAEFEYQQGQFFRFHKNPAAGEGPANTHSVQHFWLCGICCHKYTLEYRDGIGVILILPFQEVPEKPANCLVAAA